MTNNCAKCGLPLTGQEVAALRGATPGSGRTCDSCMQWIKPAFWQPALTCQLQRPQLLAEIRRHRERLAGQRELLAAIEAELDPAKLRPFTSQNETIKERIERLIHAYNDPTEETT